MSNILDYIEAYGHLNFEEKPPTDVDYVIFSQFGHIDMACDKDAGQTLRECAQNLLFDENADSLGLILPKEIVPAFRLAASKVRYGDIRAVYPRNLVDEDKESHFAAVTLVLDKNKRCIIFNGTGDTIIGWKENFLMIYRYPVTAQSLAAEYLNEICKGYRGDITVAGHSKGGNLAIYAASQCDKSIQKRIKRVFSFDGPGFCSDFYNSGGYRLIADRVTELVPQNAVIGKLFEHSGKFTVIRSGQAGLYQHDCFSWEVRGDSFVFLDDIEDAAKDTDHAVKEIINSLDEERRKLLVEALFSLFNCSDCDTLTKLSRNKRGILKNYTQLKGKSRRLLNLVFLRILRDKNLRKLLSESVKVMINQNKTRAKSNDK